MANSWGESGTSWGYGLWGEQSDTTVTLTGIGLTSSVGTAEAFHTKGWGRDAWGSGDWGTNGLSAIVSPTGIGLTSSLGDTVVEDDIEVGWGMAWPNSMTSGGSEEWLGGPVW